MGSWGSCDYKELEQLRDKLQTFQKVDYDKLALDCCNEIAARMLRKVKQKTPVLSGHLKGSWNVSSAVKHGEEWRITVYNATKYAIYVEYGHRTSNHSGWVTGRFMLTKSEIEIEKIVPKLLEKRILQKLGEVFD